MASLDPQAHGVISKKSFVSNLASKRAINSFNVRFCLRGFKLTPQDLINYVESVDHFKEGTVSYLEFKEHYFPSQAFYK